MNIKRLLLAAGVGLALMATAACGRTVEAGSAGVKVSKFGSNAGVAPQPLPVG